jgi:hypothetical protein
VALPTYVVTAVIGCLVYVGVSSPWVGGKTLAMASPAVLAAAVAGCGALLASGRLVETSLVVLVIAVGVIWSNVDQYHDVWLAPRGQLHELETIGRDFAGDGPALMTTYEPYGALRRSRPCGVRRSPTRRAGGDLARHTAARRIGPRAGHGAGRRRLHDLDRGRLVRRRLGRDRRPYDRLTPRELNWPGLYTDLGSTPLAAGEHDVEIRYQPGGWRPGSGGKPFAFGPVALSLLSSRDAISRLPASRAQTLCDRKLDWVESLG